MKFSDVNFYYHCNIDVDYDEHNRGYEDYHSGDCDINNARVVRGPIVYKAAYQYLRNCGNKSDNTDMWCVDRILTAHQVYLPENWEVNVSEGYYGQEIGSVKYGDSEKIDEDIKKIRRFKKLRPKVEFLLQLEYGYMLDGLENGDWSVQEVSKKDIIFPKDSYRQRLNKPLMDQYKDYPFFRGMVRHVNTGEGVKYSTIDGYHRISAAPPKKDFSVVVLSEQQ